MYSFLPFYSIWNHSLCYLVNWHVIFLTKKKDMSFSTIYTNVIFSLFSLSQLEQKKLFDINFLNFYHILNPNNKNIIYVLILL